VDVTVNLTVVPVYVGALSWDYIYDNPTHPDPGQRYYHNSGTLTYHGPHTAPMLHWDSTSNNWLTDLYYKRPGGTDWAVLARTWNSSDYAYRDFTGKVTFNPTTGAPIGSGVFTFGYPPDPTHYTVTATVTFGPP
jgi:hypothetical protein